MFAVSNAAICMLIFMYLAIAFYAHLVFLQDYHQNQYTSDITLIDETSIDTNHTISTNNTIEVHDRYKLVHNVYIPTEAAPRNWYGSGTSPDCDTYTNSNIINFSSYREDGFGAQLVSIMWSISLEQFYPSKYHFYYFPMQMRNHQYYDNKSYDLTAMDTFVNIGYKERNIFNEYCKCCHWNIVDTRPLDYFHNMPSLKFNDTTREYLRESYFENKHNLNVFSEQTYNIAVHIRRGDIMQWKQRAFRDIYFINIMQYIATNDSYADGDKRKVFHIYSQYNFKPTAFERKLDESIVNLKFHIEESLNLTFHGLVTADVLITSNSALSWTAAILSRAKYIFNHKLKRNPSLKQWIVCTEIECKRDKKVLVRFA